ncbi:RidA family protein [Bosea sp. (in: a-proteobacteria)]|jgi:enamine deaminase RidA (YjgF/YER057c/UK114 family)|uniref:RidA family protein n=1 Tax=Bosea sp. (in: a-proteobacteria) TaxID=1871050 RepID=UPI003F6F5AC3
MTRRLISTGSPFEQAFGYSRAVIDGDLVFVSGTTGYDYATMALPEDAAEQARNIFRTLDAVLTEAGSALSQVVRAQYFVTDRSYCEPVLAVCGEVFGEIRPAAAIYVVAGLLKPEMKVEIEVTARLLAPEQDEDPLRAF